MTAWLGLGRNGEQGAVEKIMDLTRELKDWLKQSSFLVRWKRKIWSALDGTTGVSKLDVLKQFPLYVPYTGGKYRDRAALTLRAIDQTIPFLCELSRTANGSLTSTRDIVGFPKTQEDRDTADKLKERLDFYGSDKANDHNYHHLYGALLSRAKDVRNIFEIGLGTNNIDVAANMGPKGRPGASLRAFRDLCPNAKIYGADIDTRVLFTEEHIETFYLDQTDPATFDSVRQKLPADFDLVIDDGLHAVNANIESLRFGLLTVKAGGWVVIEDISSEATCLWEVVAGLLPSAQYQSHLLRAAGAFVFAVQRLPIN
jgi:hypothetical protein